MKKIFLLILVSIVLGSSIVFSQNTSLQNIPPSDLKEQSEASLLYYQNIMDSLVKINLQRELQHASGNRLKTKELQAKLHEINVRDSTSQALLMQKINHLKKNAKGYAVAPFQDTLFKVYAKTASISPAERAEIISSKIKKLYNDPFFISDSLKVLPAENGYEIAYFSDLVVMTVSKVDALLMDKDNYQLAVEYRQKIITNLLAERKANSLLNWLSRIGQVLLIVAGLWLIIFLIKKLSVWIDARISRNSNKLIAVFSLHKYKIVTADNLQKFLLRLSKLVKIVFIIFVVYLALPLLFSLFPETKAWTTTLLDWVLSPAHKALRGVIRFLPNLFSIIVIVLIFRYSIRAIKYFVDQIESGSIEINGLYADWAQPTFRILKFLLYAFMLVLIFPYLPGSDSPAFQGVSVFIGILFSLGSSNAIANMVAGLVITYMRPFRIGDRVKIGEITGDVMEKTLLVTRIRTMKNEDITVPNSTVLLSSTTNYSTNTGAGDVGLIVHTTVTIGYDVPWKNIHKALIEAALRVDMIQKKPDPFVLQTSLDDFYVSYQINAYTKNANSLATIYSSLHQNIQDCFNEAGIEIMSPHYRNHRDGNMTTIPAEYLQKDYKAPVFNVKSVKDDDTL